jgi:DNA replication protein DnaC
LVIDDFAISPMGAAQRNDLLELLDDRIGTRSTYFPRVVERIYAQFPD